ncbi:MAG: M24 family metallopeptidase [Gracilibacteraceae bacterium]|jgi:Xaa-Pro aminopeptidase|nr:M24 family metallopeptidase [Gracilibacteraceae bacterium]
MSEKERIERLRAPIPERELRRRHDAVRAEMRAKGVDCLIMQNNNKHLGGYVRYFTDIIAENSYPVTVIFPANEEITMISSGGPPRPAFPPLWATYGVKEVIGLPYFLTFNYTNTFDAEAAVKTLKGLGVKTLGYVGPAMIPSTFDACLRANLSGACIVDFTNEVDDIKAVKSEDELVFILKAAAIQDAVVAAIPAILRPRMKDIELRNAIQHLLTDLGSEEQLLMLGSAPFGQLAKHSSPYLQNRVIGENDYISVLIEVNGPGGFYTEIARCFCLADPPKEMADLWQETVKAQDFLADQIRPGADCRTLFESINRYLREHGFEEETSLIGHGQGYDLVERPSIRPEEPMKIKPNMNIAVHPRLSTATAFTFCCDNFLTTDAAPIRLHRAPRELFVIP